MNTQLIVRLPEVDKNMLELIASNKQTTTSDIVRVAISNYLQKQTSANKNIFVKLAKIGNSKKIKKAPKDLSTNYKKYLYTK